MVYFVIFAFAGWNYIILFFGCVSSNIYKKKKRKLNLQMNKERKKKGQERLQVKN